ncbi:hypothetical protein HID58_045416 [Brassica napus]|uniref:Uncharacterized protein n=1 Tax=Brassica napus TaxID=3708 RepID=A0ABQ8ATN7_BRANA|nr:hypothetical protein HID58_045416 [Brassica napus]
MLGCPCLCVEERERRCGGELRKKWEGEGIDEADGARVHAVTVEDCVVELAKAVKSSWVRMMSRQTQDRL